MKKTTNELRKITGHEGRYSKITTGHCPYCKILMSFRGEKIVKCICCNNTIEWDIE